jgi:hypothetical protein
MSDQTKINVDVYGTTAPTAAKFGAGVSDLAGVKQATGARSDLSDRQSTTPESINGNLQYRPTPKR